MTIAERIIGTVPRAGCKVRTLRAVLHDIEAAPLDYAITGLVNAGQFLIADGFIRPIYATAVPAMPSTRSTPDARHPWKQLLAVQKDRR